MAPQLRDEYRAYKHLNTRLAARRDGDPELLKGIPKVYFYGQEPLFNYLILEYLGASLEELFDRCGRRFSVKTAAFLAAQMVRRRRRSPKPLCRFRGCRQYTGKI